MRDIDNGTISHSQDQTSQKYREEMSSLASRTCFHQFSWVTNSHESLTLQAVLPDSCESI